MTFKLRRSKERGNYRAVCMKFDCTNRDVMCEKCVKFNKYLHLNSLSEFKRLDIQGYFDNQSPQNKEILKENLKNHLK